MVFLMNRSSLSNAKKKEYLDAVLCLQSLPSLYDPAEVPGAKTRYDDFVATHMIQTLSIHGTVSILGILRFRTHTDPDISAGKLPSLAQVVRLQI